MLKRLAFKYSPMVFLLVLVIAVLCVSRYAGTIQKSNQDHAQTRDPETPISPNDAGKGAKNTGNWAETFTWPDGVTAWALLLTLFVVAWQSTETRDAAKAALMQASNITASERAWLVAEIVKNNGQPGQFYDVKITNQGRTPARFLRGDATLVNIQLPNELPVPPTYDSPMVVPRQTFIPSDKSFVVNHGYNISRHLEKGGQEGESSPYTPVIYGRIIYEDTINPGVEHETRWCFGFVMNAPRGEFVLTGPAEYTENT